MAATALVLCRMQHRMPWARPALMMMRSSSSSMSVLRQQQQQKQQLSTCRLLQPPLPQRLPEPRARRNHPPTLSACSNNIQKYVSYQQTRHYLFLPTSWTELKLRMRNHAEQRTIHVRLFLEQHPNDGPLRTRARAWMKRQTNWMIQGSNNVTATTATSSTTTTSATTTTPTLEQPLMSSTTPPTRVLFRTRARAWMTRQKASWDTHRSQLLLQQSNWNTIARAWVTRQAVWMQHPFTKGHSQLTRATAAYRKQQQRRSHRQPPRRLLPAAMYWARTAHVRKRRPLWKNATTTPLLLLQKSVTLTEYSQADWFDELTGRPLTSRDPTGRFVNPWMSQSTDGVHPVSTLVKWQWQRLQREFNEYWQSSRAVLQSSKKNMDQPNEEEEVSSQLVHVPATLVKPDLDMHSLPLDHVRLTWIGHNTCLLQHNNNNTDRDTRITILTDPMFSNRSSPFSSAISWVGFPRDVPPACSIEDLPHDIICLISHDHYDHLDKWSVRQLQHKVVLWVVPAGIGDWLQEKCDIAANSIVELEWWESVQLEKHAVAAAIDEPTENKSVWTVAKKYVLADHPQRHPMWSESSLFGNSSDDTDSPTTNHHDRTRVWVTCCPAQHWGSRTFFDRNYRLWCSFACFLPHSNNNNFLFYFGGDTAFPANGFPLFEQIRDYLGQPVDLAALPIGAYAPRLLNADAHMNPAEAVRVHTALESRMSVGVHWGTFCLSEEPMHEPPVWLAKEVAKHQDVHFVTVGHGESLTVPILPAAQVPTTTTLPVTKAPDINVENEEEEWSEEEESSSASVG